MSNVYIWILITSVTIAGLELGDRRHRSKLTKRLPAALNFPYSVAQYAALACVLVTLRFLGSLMLAAVAYRGAVSFDQALGSAVIGAPYGEDRSVNVARGPVDEPFQPILDRGAAPVLVPAAALDPAPVRWVEPAENLWLLSLRNLGLTLATFGVYHFWGRAEARRQVISSIHVNGRPLDYTATGREAFISFVVGAVVAASVVSAFAYLFLQAKSGGGATIEGIRQFRWQRLMISLPLLFLLGSIVYRKRQHVLRRTWLKGQRFDLSGQAWAYAWQHFWSAFLVPLTLGWAAPWRASRLERRKISEMHYAGQHFHASSDLKGLYKAFAVLWFGGGALYFTTLIVLSLFIGNEILAALYGLTWKPLADWQIIKTGLSVLACGLVPLALLMLCYKTAWLEHLVSSVALGDARLKLKLPRGEFIRLLVSNSALRIASLGTFAPVAEARYLRFVIGHIEVDGRLHLDPAVAIDGTALRAA